jgi:HEXXH motif-containing protein
LNPAGVPPRYRFSILQLDSLAAGTFSRDALETLLSAERSRRLLLLQALLTYVRTAPDSTGPLPAADDAWDLLLRAENADPGIVDEMLADPQTGTWVAHTLGRLRNASDDKAPLWFHVGQLHAFAFAAAIRTGVPAHTGVPVWDGAILLPSLGCLRLFAPAGWSHAEVTVGTVVRIRCAGTVTEWDPRSGRVVAGFAEWFPLRWLKSSAVGLDLAVRLDDLAAYRGLDNPTPPAPLPATDVDRWQVLLDEAWTLLVHNHTDRANELSVGMTSLVPEPAAFRFRPRSSSVENAFGCAILSEPHDATQFAVMLIHEYQHSVLNGVQHLVDLVSGDDSVVGYAPWRDDPRPVGALVHGVFAFTSLAEFWRTHRNHVSGSEAELAEFEFALWRRQIGKVLRGLRHHPALTDCGNRFLDGIDTRLARLGSEPVPASILDAARNAADDHFAGWQVNHLRADPGLVRMAAEAWRAGRPPPRADREPSVVDPDRAAQRLDARAIVTRVRFADADLFRQLQTEPHLVDGASTADVAYVGGDLETARRRYLAELSETPDRAGAWSGLGLTLRAIGQNKTAEILLRRPELLRELMTTVSKNGTPPPDELAAWLARGAG